MPEEKKKPSFPVIPKKHWWALRLQFRKSIPSVADGKYISSVLDMAEASANANIVPALRQMGIVDDSNKPTDRAVQWRDNAHYSEVCKAILKEVYPKGLLDVASGPADRDSARRWFASTTAAGEAAVNKMLSTYMLVLEADPAKKTATPDASRVTKNRATAPKAKKKPSGTRAKKTEKLDASEADDIAGHGFLTPIHFNIQLHISPDANSDQIDLIFASMAKHLKSLAR